MEDKYLIIGKIGQNCIKLTIEHAISGQLSLHVLTHSLFSSATWWHKKKIFLKSPDTLTLCLIMELIGRFAYSVCNFLTLRMIRQMKRLS